MDNTKIISATLEHLDDIMKVFCDAKKYIKEQGFDQWQTDEYPREDMIAEDIKNGSAYVLYNNEVMGYMCLSFDEEPSYSTITHGKWLSNFEYCVIHRLAISQDYLGQKLSKIFFDFAEKKCVEKNIRSLKIDTHEQNEPMKAIMKKRKYTKCGIITLENGEKRVGYEKVVIPFLVGDKIQMKKNHPCGSDIFEIKRIGADFRLECEGCHAQIWLSRSDVEKRLKKRM